MTLKPPISPWWVLLALTAVAVLGLYLGVRDALRGNAGDCRPGTNAAAAALGLAGPPAPYAVPLTAEAPPAPKPVTPAPTVAPPETPEAETPAEPPPVEAAPPAAEPAPEPAAPALPPQVPY